MHARHQESGRPQHENQVMQNDCHSLTPCEICEQVPRLIVAPTVIGFKRIGRGWACRAHANQGNSIATVVSKYITACRVLRRSRRGSAPANTRGKPAIRVRIVAEVSTEASSTVLARDVSSSCRHVRSKRAALSRHPKVISESSVTL